MEPLASALLAVFLALVGARVARQQSRFLQGAPKVSIKLDQCAGNAQADSPGLSRNSPAIRQDHNIETDRTIGSCLAELPGITKVRLFEAEPRLSGPVKEYRPVLRPLVQPDDRLLLVEARDAEALDPGRLESAGRNSKGSFVHLGTYSFSWGLASAPI